jgi:hypothetical protein
VPATPRSGDAPPQALGAPPRVYSEWGGVAPPLECMRAVRIRGVIPLGLRSICAVGSVSGGEILSRDVLKTGLSIFDPTIPIVYRFNEVWN